MFSSPRSSSGEGVRFGQHNRNSDFDRQVKGGWTEVCTLEKLRERKGRVCTVLNGRKITVAAFKNKLYAFDSACYHFGGPLGDGDIEDIGGTATIKCPWHQYRVELGTGHALEIGLDGNVIRKKKKQRMHQIRFEYGKVWIKLPSKFDLMTQYESDRYNKNSDAKQNATVARSAMTRQRRLDAMMKHRQRRNRSTFNTPKKFKEPTRIHVINTKSRGASKEHERTFERIPRQLKQSSITAYMMKSFLEEEVIQTDMDVQSMEED